MLRISFILSLLFLTATKTFAQKVTVGNNLLYDATLTPNLRVGVRLSPHWSVGLTGGYRPWPTDDQASRKWKHLLVSPDLRYWSDSVNVHHFFLFITSQYTGPLIYSNAIKFSTSPSGTQVILKYRLSFIQWWVGYSEMGSSVYI